jgi:hypothetical protein
MYRNAAQRTGGASAIFMGWQGLSVTRLPEFSQKIFSLFPPYAMQTAHTENVERWECTSSPHGNDGAGARKDASNQESLHSLHQKEYT